MGNLTVKELISILLESNMSSTVSLRYGEWERKEDGITVDTLISLLVDDRMIIASAETIKKNQLKEEKEVSFYRLKKEERGIYPWGMN